MSWWKNLWASCSGMPMSGSCTNHDSFVILQISPLFLLNAMPLIFPLDLFFNIFWTVYGTLHVYNLHCNCFLSSSIHSKLNSKKKKEELQYSSHLISIFWNFKRLNIMHPKTMLHLLLSSTWKKPREWFLPCSQQIPLLSEMSSMTTSAPKKSLCCISKRHLINAWLMRK